MLNFFLAKKKFHKTCFSTYLNNGKPLYPIVAPLPDVIQFGLSNTCNLHCVFCHQHYPGSQINNVRFTPELFSLMKKTLPYIKEAAFHDSSEFFIDPKFSHIVKLCNKHKVAISLNTNGTYLPETHVTLLRKIKTQLNITISLDATDKNTYLKLRRFSFEKTLKNAEILIDIIKYKQNTLASTDKTHIISAFVIMKENIDQAIDFLHLSKKMGFDQVQYYRLIQKDPCFNNNNFDFDYMEQGPWNFKEKYNTIIDGLNRESKILNLHCLIPAKYPITS